MKKIKWLSLLIAVSLVGSLGFVSCHHDSDEEEEEEVIQNEEEDTTVTVSFNIANAKLLASSNSSLTSRYARAAGDNYSSLLKVLTDGSVIPAMEVEGEFDEGETNGKIKGIIKSPKTEHVYLWNNYPVYAKGWNQKVFDSLVCIRSDGTYKNILTQKTQFRDEDILLMDDASWITFDDSGNAYFMARDPGFYDVFIYKYDPTTDSRTLLMSEISEYEGKKCEYKMENIMVSKDGKYVYVGLRYDSCAANDLSNFDNHVEYSVKVIPINNLNDAVEIRALNLSWVYNTYDEKLYVSCKGLAGEDYPEGSSYARTYCYSKDGKSRGNILVEEYFSYLFTSKAGVWGKVEPYVGEPTKFKNILATDNTASATIDYGDYFEKTERWYIDTGDYVYLCFQGQHYDLPDYQGNEAAFNNDYLNWVHTNYVYQIWRLNPTNSSLEKVFVNSPVKDYIYIDSWTTDGKELYYSGYNKTTPYNGKVDLSTFEHRQVSADKSLANFAIMN